MKRVTIIVALLIGVLVGAWGMNAYIVERDWCKYKVGVFEDDDTTLWYDVETSDGVKLGTIRQESLDSLVVADNL
jgi:hypothetical protein